MFCYVNLTRIHFYKQYSANDPLFNKILHFIISLTSNIFWSSFLLWNLCAYIKCVALTKQVDKHGHDSFLYHHQLSALSVLESSSVPLQPCFLPFIISCHRINTSNHLHSRGEARQWVTHMLPLKKADKSIVQDIVSKERNYTKEPERSSFHLILPVSRPFLSSPLRLCVDLNQYRYSWMFFCLLLRKD